MYPDVDYWVNTLGLQAHVEGGYFKEVFRSPVFVPANALPQGYESARNAATVIYYLLRRPAFSAFHQLKAHETWHFHAGAPLQLHLLDPKDQTYTLLTMGYNLPLNEAPIRVVEPGQWLAATVQPATYADYSLVSCVSTPGFDYRDLRQANKTDLTIDFPNHAQLISQLSLD